jgi:Uma2 family endonuclease
MEAQSLNMSAGVRLSDQQFHKLCIANKQCQLELTAEGKLVIMPLDTYGTSLKKSEFIAELASWNHYKKAGYVFSATTEFHLPNGAYRSPDISWIVLERWQALSPSEQKCFPPLSPDFVVEVGHPTEVDKLTIDSYVEEMREKMWEYLENGTRLGWLINLVASRVEIYRVASEVETINFSSDRTPILSGEDVMPGFHFDLSLILGSKN